MKATCQASLALLLCFFCISVCGNTFKQHVLAEHNRLRRKHGVRPLRLNPKLNKYAQEHAESLAENGVLRNSGRQYGENLFMVSSSQVIGATVVVRTWYNEIKKYNFSDPGFSRDTGHFTQVVWGGSRKLGVGHATSDKNAVYVVAMYSPAGNVLGRFSGNVRPPKSISNTTTVNASIVESSTAASSTAESSTPESS